MRGVEIHDGRVVTLTADPGAPMTAPARQETCAKAAAFAVHVALYEALRVLDTRESPLGPQADEARRALRRAWVATHSRDYDNCIPEPEVERAVFAQWVQDRADDIAAADCVPLPTPTPPRDDAWDYLDGLADELEAEGGDWRDLDAPRVRAAAAALRTARQRIAAVERAMADTDALYAVAKKARDAAGSWTISHRELRAVVNAVAAAIATPAAPGGGLQRGRTVPYTPDTLRKFTATPTTAPAAPGGAKA